MSKLENLDQFTGTENYYTNPLYPFEYTDGIKYLAENGGAYWLLDAIASWQKELDLSQIQFWRLKVNPDNSAVLTCERDADEPVIAQEIPFTDFPLEKISLYLCDGVLLLPSEY
jgi:hypothetical protein